MHVIVTGAAGFIGRNVTAAFLRDGHRVTILDSIVGTLNVLEAVRTSQAVYGNGKQVRDLESDVMLVERPA